MLVLQYDVMVYMMVLENLLTTFFAKLINSLEAKLLNGSINTTGLVTFSTFNQRTQCMSCTMGMNTILWSCILGCGRPYWFDCILDITCGRHSWTMSMPSLHGCTLIAIRLPRCKRTNSTFYKKPSIFES